MKDKALASSAGSSVAGPDVAFPFLPPTVCVLIDPPASGPWNMAVDEALLEAADQGQCTLRFYQWQEPTLSLGYFQTYAHRWQHEASRGCAVVRRASGGGAIVHDNELTYSLAIAADHPSAIHRLQLYQAVHVSLIEALTEWDVHANLCASSVPEKNAVNTKDANDTNGDDDTRNINGIVRSAAAKNLREKRPSLSENSRAIFIENAYNGSSEPFLCFQRRTPGDVLLDGVKIAGSAQRRCRGAVLQHGSVLLGRTVAAPELPGLSDLSGKCVEPQQLIEVWFKRLTKTSATRRDAARLSQEQRNRAGQLVEMKYGNPTWTQNRSQSDKIS